MRLIGLTGSIACGKSTVSHELIRRGFSVIDGDLLARELTVPGGAAISSIRNVFGPRYITPEGAMNRREMSRLVFSDPIARERLDQVMAPFLQERTLKEIENSRRNGAKICFLDMPLLFEKGYDRLCDTVWCVWLPEELQLERLMSRDGCSREDALNRMRAVLSSDEKANRSAFVIDNSGSVEETLLQVEEQLDKELLRAEPVSRRRRSAPLPDASPAETVSSAPYRPVPEIMDRPVAAKKHKPERRAAWTIPRWLRILLVSFASFLIVSFTAQMLMNAYLAQRNQAHIQEQEEIDQQYPLMYLDQIMQYSDEYNLSPSLVAAIIRNESSFRPMAESSVGARGLMQLMPDTAEWISGKLRVESFQFDQMYDPEMNIRFGCWYLNYLSSLFGGNPLSVVCAYHAGQGEVSSWLANPMYSSNGVTLNQASLPEGPTKTYAGRVTRDYGIYKEKYFTDNPGLITDSSPDPVP